MYDIRPRPRKQFPRPTQPMPLQQPQPQSQPLPSFVPLESSRSNFPPELQLPPNRSRKKRFRLVGIGILILVIIGASIGGISWYNAMLQPRSSTVSRIRIEVVSGESADAIGNDLEQKGVIQSALAFSLYAKQSGQLSKLKAGTYLFSPTQSVRQLMTWLVEGKVDSFNVTILPGQTLAQIKASLITYGFDAASIDTAFSETYSSPLLNDKPAGVNLEGYIFPDTYTVTSETTVEQLLELTFADFYGLIQQKGLEPALLAKGFNLHQGITLASIIQREASTSADRRQVAQVFEKRLQSGIALGSDVTYMYAAKLLGVTPSVDLDSPYNTRKYPGLPPGAIANFTLDSLQAVANPAPGDYLYFVAGDDGKVYFAQTEAEHQQNINKYCKQLCQ